MHYEYKLKPYSHQSEALNRSVNKSIFAYFMEMGTGKTKVAIDEIGVHFCDSKIDLAIIFAPKGVYMNWINTEIPKHLGHNVMDSAYVLHWVSGGGNQSHMKKLKSFLEYDQGLRVFVINIESFSSGTKAINYVERLLTTTEKCSVYVDESTTIKNHKSNRTKKLIQVFAKSCVHFKRIMTGSPVTKSPIDLFSQFEFLQSGALGSRSYWAFRSRYAILQEREFGGRKVQIEVGYRNTEELTARVDKLSFRVTKDECLDLPEKIYIRRDVELSDEQRKMYSEMKEFAFTELENNESGFVTASAVITQILRLHQIVCGHVTDEDGVVHSLNNKRIDALMDTIDETAGDIIIWARYRHDISKIVETLSKKYGPESVAQFHGGNTNTRDNDANRFINNEVCRFMVSNQQSGGYGNTWVNASTVIYYSNDYDLEKRLQSEDRAHRAGQTKSVTYVDLVSPGTVDEKILKALRNKINLSASIMGDDYKEWLL